MWVIKKFQKCIKSIHNLLYSKLNWSNIKSSNIVVHHSLVHSVKKLAYTGSIVTAGEILGRSFSIG